MTQAQLENVFQHSEAEAAEAAEAVMNLLSSQAGVPPESPQQVHQLEEKTLPKAPRLRSKIAVKRKASSSMSRTSQKNAAKNFRNSTSNNSNLNSSQFPPQIASGKPDELCNEKFCLNGLSQLLIIFSHIYDIYLAPILLTENQNSYCVKNIFVRQLLFNDFSSALVQSISIHSLDNSVITFEEIVNLFINISNKLGLQIR